MECAVHFCMVLGIAPKHRIGLSENGMHLEIVLPPLLDTHGSASTRDTSKIKVFSTLDAFYFFKWNTPILDGKQIG